MGQTGIYKSYTDKEQPYRVWFEDRIIWFARTLEEARIKLEMAKRKEKEVK